VPFEISVHIFPPNFSDFEDIFEVCPNKFWQNSEKLMKVKVSFQFDELFLNFKKFVKVCLHF